MESLTLADRRWLSGKLETQALYGTKVVVLSRSGSWSKIAVTDQPTRRDRRGYPGWLPTRQLTKRAPEKTTRIAVVRAPTTWLWRDAASVGTRRGRIMELSYGTRLSVRAVTKSTVEVFLLGGGTATVARSAVVLRSGRWRDDRSRVLNEAKKFLGLPYLWGGTSGFGYDCSGLTYSVLHALGVTIPRDAKDQARSGTIVPRARLERGDLVFFRNSSGVVVHTGIYAGEQADEPMVLHSPGSGSAVKLTPLSWWPDSRYAGARRYL
jgi:cell wall-associated NlpC family hydrolase